MPHRAGGGSAAIVLAADFPDNSDKTEVCVDRIINLIFLVGFSVSLAYGGCVITANRLKTGAEIWKRKLDVLPAINHFAYSNDLIIGLSSDNWTDLKDEEVVLVKGHESYGDYTAILDRRSGQLLASKIYRTVKSK